jgi:hypothetical protein
MCRAAGNSIGLTNEVSISSLQDFQTARPTQRQHSAARADAESGLGLLKKSCLAVRQLDGFRR